MDEAIVIGFEIPDDEGPNGLPRFRIVLTSKQLLEHASGAEVRQIQADATYKLIWQGFPVLIFGFSNANKRFHPLSIAISSHEAEDDFRFAFQALKQEITELNPEFCLSDGATAIYNGAEAVWPGIQRAMCNSHEYMN